MRRIRIETMVLALAGVVAWGQAQESTAAQVLAQGAQRPAFTATPGEVVLDIIVRDRKGKPITDLKRSELKVTDDGQEQTPTGFRLVAGREAIENGSRMQLDTMRQIRLVTLVFERLGTSARRIARDAAESLIKDEKVGNVYFAVVAIDSQLFALQEFTRDKDALKKAIEKATSGQYATYAEDSERIKKGLRAAGPAGRPEVETRLASVLLNMLQFDSSFGREEATRMTIFSLLSLTRGLYGVPGRKTVVYFSEGLEVPTHLDEPFRSIPGVANRGNVSIYAVDARGVQTSSQNQGTKDLAKAARLTGVATMTTQTAGVETVTDPAESAGAAATPAAPASGAVTKDELRASDMAESSMRKNTQLPLQTLSEATGGFLMTDSNDLTRPMGRVNEEIGSYYEYLYNPGISDYDGRLRKTKVEVERKDAVARTRVGYFALPLNLRGPVTMPFEVALMKALAANPMPREVEFRAAALAVKPGSEAQGLVIVEVPMSGIKFSEHLDSKTFSSRVSLLSLVKDQKGAVVGKVSTDLPRNGPLALLPQARAGNFIYTEPLTLPPGRYTLETAVMDHEAGKVGTRKTSYVVAPPHKGVAMSSLFLVRNFQPNYKDLSPSEPLQYHGGKITATLSGHVYRVKGAQLSTFFVVYPDPSIAEKPVALVEFSVDGKVIAKGQLPLPDADAQGRVPYVMSSPAENMPPATYLVHVTVKQGDSTAEEMAQVQVLEQ